jgi:hypothetical protein
MKTALNYIPEPMLQFGDDQHPDIRYGIANFRPYDLREKRRRTSINLGIVGTAAGIASASRWIQQCRNPIPGEPSPKRILFAPFPGFSNETAFQTDCILDGSLNAEVQPESVKTLQSLKQYNDRVIAAVDLFLRHLRSAAQKKPAVILLVMPLELLALLGEDPVSVGEGDDAPAPRPVKARRRGKFNFHDMVKAKALSLGVPIQLARPSTFDRSLKSKEKDDFARSRNMQDEATCAWNFFVALYYKAGGYPWRLIRDPTERKVCYIGISFYEALDGSRLNTSVAQVFDELGHGLLVQGGVVQ